MTGNAARRSRWAPTFSLSGFGGPSGAGLALGAPPCAVTAGFLSGPTGAYVGAGSNGSSMRPRRASRRRPQAVAAAHTIADFYDEAGAETNGRLYGMLLSHVVIAVADFPIFCGSF